ncbi:hypothetical protein H5410_030227 [Solanum commersonii]|uniref:Uncharacterized protein n=1 Tax=Solanum commersonii TaxID=4109 RepID=A0A9J5YF17_SOLCO|nr:hypothetical protein H5410_030227 [Solanum commersonii]
MPPCKACTQEGGMTVVPNEKNELVPMRPASDGEFAWIIEVECTDLKDHFPMPFMDRCWIDLRENEDRNLVPNWEKCHFMVKVKKGIEVDRAKVEFIKDFSKIAHPLCKPLEKECKFYFDDDRLRAFEELKKKLVTKTNHYFTDWGQPLESEAEVERYDGRI